MTEPDAGVGDDDLQPAPVDPDDSDTLIDSDADTRVEVRDESSGVSAATRRMPRVAVLSLAVAAFVLATDQLSKHWAVNTLSDGRDRHVVWTLQWNLARNSGMAFSRGQGIGPVIGLLAFAVVIVLVVGTSKADTRAAKIAGGLLIGGALGNLCDRVFRGRGWLHGAVIDFIDFQWWPIFNIADIGVSVGAVLFLLVTFFQSNEARRAASDAT